MRDNIFFSTWINVCRLIRSIKRFSFIFLSNFFLTKINIYSNLVVIDIFYI